jgi:hypothetical protein
MEKQDITRVLTVLGYGPLAYDESVKAFQKDKGLTVDGIVGPKTSAAMLQFPKKGMMAEVEIRAKYGEPGDIKNLVRFNSPYLLTVAWDKNVKVKGFECHAKVVDRLTAIHAEILSVYGQSAIGQLGIDLWGGCYNYRKMRGGDSWSRHSWGIAEDRDPDRNQLHETIATARFARPEYAAMIWIYYKHGFLSQGWEKGFDWMHFEAAL